ncbi:L-aspartate oxidase [Butyricicoccus sp.]|uniref:L-aspartate oxidase n=1 Tax=Butyricicoccus sp. TaxID=2049021 RepID=UPI003F178DBB
METADILVVGTGAAGLFNALQLPQSMDVLVITKEEADHSDSFLAQGGMCVLLDEDDYDSYFEDTMKAGHYENNKESVDIMIRSSQHIAQELVDYGVDFQRDEDGCFVFTREGAHSENRILFHEDLTGREITGKLLERAKERKNIRIEEHTTLVDLLCDDKEKRCCGAVVRDADGTIREIRSRAVVLATGGLGGLFRFSTNFPHISGDALAIAMRHGIEIEHINYIQIHPTTLYTTKPGRRFLISESVRGEGAYLLNAKGERFVNELLPRDLLAKEIGRQMKIDNRPYVELSVTHLDPNFVKKRFPNIYRQCLEEGYDMTKEPIPVTPGQHYFMGGIKVDLDSKTSMDGLYAVGETSCNGVHGRNRLASNSLLESLVFAERAANHAAAHISTEQPVPTENIAFDPAEYADIDQRNRKAVLDEIKRKDEAFYEQWLHYDS